MTVLRTNRTYAAQLLQTQKTVAFAAPLFFQCSTFHRTDHSNDPDKSQIDLSLQSVPTIETRTLRPFVAVAPMKAFANAMLRLHQAAQSSKLHSPNG
jgi:hypothetical protein